MSVFAGWPPELISGMIYSGPGSGPMLEAAAAWEALAADLQSTATSFQSLISAVTGAWQGPSSTTMTSATEPYLAWIQNTAAQALQAGAQANMAGTAYDTAFGATVPPPAIAANRAQLMALTATNFFGQNTPAIAATEAEYAGMWAQDVAMMINYSLTAIQATILQPFTAAPSVASGALSQAMTAPVGLANSLGSLPTTLSNSLASLPTSLSNSLASLPQLVPTALTQLVTPTALTDPSGAISGILNTLGLGSGTSGVSSLLGGSATSTYPLQVAYYGTMIGTTPARMFMGMGQSMANSSTGLMDSQGLLNSIGQFVDGKMQLVAGNVVGNVANQLKSWGAAMSSAVSAQLAHASTVGHLSVPQAWSMAAPAMNVSRAAPVLPATSVSAPSLTPPSAGMPGGPFGQALMGALSGRGLSSIGVKTPKVIPRSPAGG